MSKPCLNVPGQHNEGRESIDQVILVELWSIFNPWATQYHTCCASVAALRLHSDQKHICKVTAAAIRPDTFRKVTITARNRRLGRDWIQIGAAPLHVTLPCGGHEFCLCRSEIGLLRVRWQNSNSIYWFETQRHFAFVWGSCIVPPLSLTQLVTGMERKSKSHATVVFLDPLKAAVQFAVSQWLDHLLVFEWISLGESLSKAGWMWSLHGTPDEL